MKSTRAVLSSRQLSPYAKALKHVALRGRAALGPSAKEQELMMYLRGQLPADYRPPAQGQWDDTIERWTYAWQFPADEEGQSRSVQLAKLPSMRHLTDFCHKLLEAPPSLLPAATSTHWPPVAGTLSPTTAAEDALADAAAVAEAAEEAAANSEAAAFLDALEDTDAAGGGSAGGPAKPQPSPADGSDGLDSLPPEDDDLTALVVSAAADISSGAAAVGALSGIPMDDVTGAMLRSPQLLPPLALGTATDKAQALAAKLGVPKAYIDDGTELAAASKALGLLLIDEYGLTYEPRSLASVITALAILRQGPCADALFRFALQVGFPPSSMLFAARANVAAGSGDVNSVMALIEEAKSVGVTPERPFWHVLMRAFLKAGDSSAVIEVIDNMKAYGNIEPDEQTFLLHLQALATDKTRESAVYEAISIFDTMEHTYGLIPNRYLYHEMMRCLAQHPKTEMRTRLEDLAKKMALIGIPWDARTYELLLTGAGNAGDIPVVKDLFARMRDEKISVNLTHLSIAANAYAVSLVNRSYDEMKEKGEDPVALWVSHATTVFGMYELVLQRGWSPTVHFVNALLRMPCEIVGLSVQYVADQKAVTKKFEDQAATIWEKTFKELSLRKNETSYHAYIRMLGRQLRIDEAESLFTEMCLQKGMTPKRRTYEELMWMHLNSGEEGGTARALHYMEAMERAKIPIKPSTLKTFVRVTNEAAYRRDMKRRARRIMQAREEYLARKEEGVEFQSPAPYQPPSTTPEGLPALTPLPLSATSTLAWWDQWKRQSLSKHELFEVEGGDGMPLGESFAEKNDALRKLGIESKFLAKSDVPDPSRHRLLPLLRKGGGMDPAGSLWALDGGDMVYPKPGINPEGWGTTLWRERQVLKKALQATIDGKAAMPPLSAQGNAMRLAPQQLAIERSGATMPGDLSDALAFPGHVYDDGKLKPASEMAFPVPHTAELVWQRESKDELSAFKLDEELAAEAPLENENAFLSGVRVDAATHVAQAINAIQRKEENATTVAGKGVTRKSKHDYLEKWREMYRHGTMEVPDEPVLAFGRTQGDHTETLAATIRAWYAKNRKAGPATEEQLEVWKEEKDRRVDYAASRRNLRALRHFKRTAKKEDAETLPT